MHLHTSIFVNTDSYSPNMHMYSVFTVGHYTQYYTDKPQWAEKNWEKKVVAFINFINIFKGEISNLIMKL